MTTLPDTLHELMRLALDDLKLCAQDPRYSISMGTWHEPRYVHGGKTCLVCMAGAIMAQTLHIPPGKNITPVTLNHNDRRKMLAVDKARCGSFLSALRKLTGSYAYEEEPRTQQAVQMYKVIDDSLLKDHNQILAAYPYSEEHQPAWFEAWHKVIEKLKELEL